MSGENDESCVPTLLVHGDRKDIQDGTSLDKHVPSVVDLQFQK